MAEASIVILQLFVLFTAAKVLGGLGSMIRIPSVVGEILAGVVLGNTFLKGALHLEGAGIEFLAVLAELGVVFLIFLVGLETPFEEMRKVGGVSLLVAIAGVIVPFVAGFGLMWALGYTTIEGLFIGAALVATSVGITARVLSEIGVLGRKEARIILGAAVIDDVLGLIVLTVVQALGEGGAIDPLQITFLIAQALGFVGVLMLFGGRVARRILSPQNPLSRRWEWASPAGALFALAIIVCLGLSAVAVAIGLAAIIGAFVAGMAFAATDLRHPLVERFEGLVQFTTPFFFGYIGLQINLQVFGGAAALVASVTILALLTKVIGCGIGALSLGRKSALAIGIGMMPRGEVGIIVALIGLSLHAISGALYATVVAMSLLTTLVTPPLLVWAFKRLPKGTPS